MKKILIVTDGFPPLVWGSVSSIALTHARGLKALGWNVRVFTTTQDTKQKTGWDEFEGIPVRTFYANYHPRWWAYKSLNNKQITGEFRKELEAFAPEVVHFHNIHQYFSYRSIAIAKQAGAKVFLTAHDVMSFAYQKLHHFINYSSTAIPTSFNYFIPWRVNARDARKRFNPFRNLIIRSYLRKVDQIFAVSEALKQALGDNGIKGNVSVVHNGIDTTSFQQPFNEEGLRQELGLPSKKVVLFVGRFTPDKGRDVLLQALARVPGAYLLVVGLPKNQKEPVMEALIDKLGIRGRVVFVPFVPQPDVWRYYKLAQVVVCPSIIFDSFPTINLEGMAAGKPVVATCFGGSREAVQDGVTGYIINPLNTELFAQKLSELLADDRKAHAMGAAGLGRVKDVFSLDQQLKGYTGSYTRA